MLFHHQALDGEAFLIFEIPADAEEGRSKKNPSWHRPVGARPCLGADPATNRGFVAEARF